MKMKLGFLLGLSLFSQMAMAGGTAGNGGNAVVCYRDTTKKEIVSIQMFDYWEMAQAFPIPGGVSVSNPNAPLDQIITELTGRIAKIDPEKAARFNEEALRIARNVTAYLKDSVPVIHDDNSKFSPKAPCYKEQFAVQILEPAPSERRFAINKGLYVHPKNTNLQRAGIILHEVIYRYTMEVHGHKNSDGARKLNYYLATNALPTISADNFEALLKSSGTPSGFVKLEVKALNTSFWGKSLSGTIFSVGRLATLNKNPVFITGTLDAGSIFKFATIDKRDLTTIESKSGIKLDLKQQDGVIAQNVTFSEQGNIASISLKTTQDLKVGNRTYGCLYSVALDATRAVTRCTIIPPATIYLNGGRALQVSAVPANNSLDLEFNAAGLVVDWKGNYYFQMPIKLADSTSVLNPWSAQINERGEAISTRVTLPIIIPFSSKTKITVLPYRQFPIGNGVIQADAVMEVVDLKVKGLQPIFMNGDSVSKQVALCRVLAATVDSQNVDARVSSAQIELSPIEVIGKKDFFDAEKGMKVTIVDDKVYIAKSATCMMNMFIPADKLN